MHLTQAVRTFALWHSKGQVAVALENAGLAFVSAYYCPLFLHLKNIYSTLIMCKWLVIAKSHFGFLPAFPSSMNLSCLSMCPYFALFSVLLSFCSPARHQLPLQLWQLLSLQSFEDTVPTHSALCIKGVSSGTVSMVVFTSRLFSPILTT